LQTPRLVLLLAGLVERRYLVLEGLRHRVSEESDSGIVPMNYSNKIEQSMAESEEGRPLIKENIHQSSTRPTQSGTRVSQGLAGVRKASF